MSNPPIVQLHDVGRLYYTPPPGTIVAIGEYVVGDIVVWPIEMIHLSNGPIYSVAAINLIEIHNPLKTAYPREIPKLFKTTSKYALFNKIELTDFMFATREEAKRAIRIAPSNIKYAKIFEDVELLHLAMSRGLPIEMLPKPLNQAIIYAHITIQPQLASESLHTGIAREKLLARSMLAFKWIPNPTYKEALTVAVNSVFKWKNDCSAATSRDDTCHPLVAMPREFLTPELVSAALAADYKNVQFLQHIALSHEQLDDAFARGASIRFVPNPTLVQRATAIRRDWNEIRHIDKPTVDECAIAIASSQGEAVCIINMTPELFCELFKRQFKGLLQLCSIQTPELIAAAIQAHPSNILEVRSPSVEARMMAIEIEPMLIGSIEQTEELAIAAVSRNAKTIRVIKEKFIDPCVEYLRSSNN